MPHLWPGNARRRRCKTFASSCQVRTSHRGRRSTGRTHFITAYQASISSGRGASVSTQKAQPFRERPGCSVSVDTIRSVRDLRQVFTVEHFVEVTIGANYRSGSLLKIALGQFGFDQQVAQESDARRFQSGPTMVKTADLRENRVKSLVALVLAFAAGFVDIVGYLSLYHAFTAHMTGTTVQLAHWGAMHDWEAAGVAAGIIAAFVLVL